MLGETFVWSLTGRLNKEDNYSQGTAADRQPSDRDAHGYEPQFVVHTLDAVNRILFVAWSLVVRHVNAVSIRPVPKL